MKQQLGLMMVSVVFVSGALAAPAEENVPVLFSADLSNASPGTSPSPIPFYPKECAKLPAPGSFANAAGKAVLAYFPNFHETLQRPRE